MKTAAATKQPVETWDERMDRIIGIIKLDREYDVPDCRFSLRVTQGHVITVVDKQTGLVSAYSSTRADFDQSIEEFTEDYLA